MTKRAWLVFGAVSVIWGIPYLFIKIAVRDGVSPASVAWARVTLAAVVLLALAWRTGTLSSLRGRWPWLAGYALVEVAVPFPLIGFGEERVASSLAAIIIAAVPLLGAVIALRYDRSERPTPLRAAGLAVGFAGVVVLVGIDVAGSSRELLGAAAILIAALGYAIGPMILKHRLAGIDPGTLMGGSLLAGAILLTPLAALDPPQRVPSAGAIGALVVLGLVCTALAFVLITVLVREVGTGRAMVVTYINPVVAVALGVALLDERLRAGALLGLLLILSGSWISTGGQIGPFLHGLTRRRGGRSAATAGGARSAGGSRARAGDPR